MKDNVINRLKRSVFIKNVTKLVSGRLGAALVSFLLVPVVARLFTPQDYGVVAFLVSVVVVIGPISTLCYELAVVIPAKDREAVALIQAVIFALLVTGLGVWIVVLFEQFFSFLGPTFGAMGGWIWLAPVLVVVLGLNNALESWLVRSKRFGLIASAGILNAFVVPGSRILFGQAFGSSIWALAIGYLLGGGGRLWLMWREVSGELRASFVNISRKDVRNVAAEYRDFPIYNTPARFIRQVSNNLPVLMFGYFYAPEIVGFYAMANRLVQLPAEAFMNAVRKVYLQKAAEIAAKGKKLNRELLLMTLGMGGLGLIPFSVLFLFGQSILVVLLGKEWQFAGVYAELLAPLFFSMWVCMPSAALYIILRKQRTWLYIQLFSLLFKLPVFVVSQMLGLSPEEALKIFVIVCVLLNIGIIAVSHYVFWNMTVSRGGASFD